MKNEGITITIIAENTAKEPLKGEHGFSCFIEIDSLPPILFDTGRDVLFHNALHLKKDLKTVSTLILSHGHYDHTDALSRFYTLNPNATLVCSEHIFTAHYSKKTGIPRPVGLNEENKKTINALPSKSKTFFTESQKIPEYPIEVFGNIEQKNQVEKPSPLLSIDQAGIKSDTMIDESVISIETDKGLILITGCCHCGFMNMCTHIEKKTGKNIHAVIGGFHLSGVSKERMSATVDFITEKKIDRVYPCHCTGNAETEYLQTALPSIVKKAYCGMEIQF